MVTIAADGGGGLYSALSFCFLYREKYEETVDLHLICGKSTYDAVNQFVPDWIYCYHHHESAKDLDLAAKLIKKDPDTFILTPDYFGTVPLYDISRTNIDWPEIQEYRCLKSNFEKPTEKNVFLGLLTAQENNSYGFPRQLIKMLCEELPECKFYYADVKTWAHKNVQLDFSLDQLKSKYSNFIPYIPESLAADLDFLGKNMLYFLTLDNGIGNFAYRIGRKRILLDSRYNNLAFRQRWRSNAHDLIPIDTAPLDIVKTFKLIVRNPELNISKDIIARLPEDQLFQMIGYKTKTCFNK